MTSGTAVAANQAFVEDPEDRRMHRSLRAMTLIAGTLTGPLLTNAASAEPRCIVRIGGPVTTESRVSFDAFDHSDFGSLLRRYVDREGQVCYSRWKEHCCDVNRLAAYLHRLGLVDPSAEATRQARMAYYINAYNALTLWGILDAYPVASIQRLDGKHSRYAIFEDLEVWLGDRYLSLNGIENDALRPMGDPRIHFALVCAARGCPRLRNDAYSAGRIERQLDDNAADFFVDSSHFHLSRLTGTVHVSPILKWYREDFGRTDCEVVTTVFPYLPVEDRRWLSEHGWWKLHHLGYDWGLNDRCPTPSVALGRIPYCVYSWVSPAVELFRHESSDTSEGGAIPPPVATGFDDAVNDTATPRGMAPLPALSRGSDRDKFIRPDLSLDPPVPVP